MIRVKAELLEIETTLPVQSLLSLKGKVEKNCHGICCFSFQLAEISQRSDIESFLCESAIRVKHLNNMLFSGVIDNIKIENQGEAACISVRAVTNSIQLDREKRNRSFQDTEMTYYEVAKEVVRDNKNVQLVWNLDKNKKIDHPLIQYKETDWEFIVRIVSHFHSFVMVDEAQDTIKLYVGIEQKDKGEIENFTVWEYGISPRYFENSAWDTNNTKSDYLYCILETKENRHIGDKVKFLGKQMIICRKELFFEKGESKFRYHMGADGFFLSQIQYNSLFKGLQLEGVVESVEGENVKVRLMIDGDSEQELFPYPWTPITGNIFYCMPEVKSKVLIQFLGEDERNAVVKSIARLNGDECDRYLDSQDRRLETLKEKMLELFPEELVMRGIKGNNISELRLCDKAGINVATYGKLEIAAIDSIIMKAEEVQCSAPISIVQCVGQSNLEIHQDFNLYSPAGVENVQVSTKDTNLLGDVTKEKVAYTPYWQTVYASLGSITPFGSNMSEATALEMDVMAGIPAIGSGKLVVAMSKVVSGISYSENKFADAFKMMKVDVMNGGYPLPQNIDGG